MLIITAWGSRIEEEQLRELKSGTKQPDDMAVDADGKERGFGFVQFGDAATQAAAIEALDKRPLNGRTLNVRAVEERAPALTLYRDTNGWCPFCERVWVALEKKGIPYDEVLINLQDKPDWYKEIVPTTLVPAIAAVAVCIFLLLIAEFSLVRLTSSLSLSIFGARSAEQRIATRVPSMSSRAARDATSSHRRLTWRVLPMCRRDEGARDDRRGGGLHGRAT